MPNAPVQAAAPRHPRTNLVWLRRLLGGSAIAHRVDRHHALYRLRNLGLVDVYRVGKIGHGYVPTFRAALTGEGVVAAGAAS